MSVDKLKVVALSSLPFVVSLFLGFHHGDAEALDLNAKDMGDHCAPPTEDCAIVTVPAPDKRIESTCDHILSASASELAVHGKYWVATDRPCR